MNSRQWRTGFFASVLAVVMVGGCGSDAAAPASGSGGKDGGGDSAVGGSGGTGGTDAGGGSGGKVAVDGGGTDAPDATAGGLPLAQFGKAFADTMCAKIYSCCPPARIAANPRIGPDEATCRGVLGGASSALATAIADSQSMAKASYDPVKMAACIQALAATSCTDARAVPDLSETLPACKGAVLPKVAVGGACLNNFDCVNGWCDTNGLTCAALKAAGQVCDDDDECTGLNCLAGTCSNQTKDGLCTIGEP